MASKPNTAPDTKGGWAIQGFTEVQPADPSPSQGDSDILRGSPGPREQELPEQAKIRKDFQRGDLKSMISKDAP